MVNGSLAPAVETGISEKDTAKTFGESNITLSHGSTAVAGGSVELQANGSLNQSVLLDDFEDGDTTPELPEWSDLPSKFAVQTGTTVSGNYSAELLSANESVFGVNWNRTNAAVSIKFDVLIDQQSTNASDGVTIELIGTNGTIGRVVFDDTEPVRTHNATDIISSWSTNTVYTVEMVADYATNTLHAGVNGNFVSGGFVNNNSQLSYINFENFTSNSGITRSAYFDDFYEGAYTPKTGQVSVEWSEPADVFKWDAASFQATLANESVDVFVEESTDGGSTWTEVAGPIKRGDEIPVASGNRMRFRVDLTRSDTANNPTLDAIARRYIL